MLNCCMNYYLLFFLSYFLTLLLLHFSLSLYLSLSRFCFISHLIHTIKLLKILDRSGRRIFAVVPNNKDHVPGRILVSSSPIQFQFIILYYSSMELILNYVKKSWLAACMRDSTSLHTVLYLSFFTYLSLHSQHNPVVPILSFLSHFILFYFK